MEVKLIERSETNFPDKLRSELITPPIKKLWYRGEWPRLSREVGLFSKCAAVVGSRRMSRYGRQAVAEIVPRLCGAGYTIVSGLMYGVDQLAHRTTLDCGGQAMAVLGYGIINKNEEGAYQMAEEIVEGGGLVISEYEGEAVSQRWMFPQRNRIVVALSEIVVVVEAGSKSGSLGTAKLAKEYGKKVYAVPGPIFSSTSEGTNSLIAGGKAEMLSLEQLTKLTGVESQKGREKEVLAKLNAGEREIYTVMRIEGPQSCNEIARSLNIPTREILALLSQMEMKGAVVVERGVWRVS